MWRKIMNDNEGLAYSEVDEILNNLEDEYVEKIPMKIRQFFKETKNKEYKPIIRTDVPLEEQNLKRETIILLAILNLNYWCESEEEKQELLNSFSKNEELKEQERKELEERYNPDNLFKKRKNEIHKIIEDSNKQLVEYKEKNFIQKLFDKIIKFLRRNK